MHTTSAAAVALLLAMTGGAFAEGERTPMVGGSITYSDAADHDTELVGGQLEVAWWVGRFGLALEGALRHGVTNDDVRNLALAGSARLLVADWMWPSLFEARDVEMGVELHAIAERTWWGHDDRDDALGFGAAIRMRGGSDWEFSPLIAESRLFIRVMKTRGADDAVAFRAAPGSAVQPANDGYTVMIGVGAAFGNGKPRYLDRFRWHPPEFMR